MVQVQEVYYGLRDDMIAEVAAWNPLEIGVSPRECKYLVLPIGDAGNFDTAWTNSKSEARLMALEIARANKECRVVSLCHK